MKLITDLPVRRDGTVVAWDGAKNWVFRPDEAGDVVCDVDSDEALALLLSTGDFQPYDEADLGTAVALASGSKDADDDGEGDGDDEGDGEGEDEAPQGGLPVEAGTPPAARPGKGRKAR